MVDIYLKYYMKWKKSLQVRVIRELGWWLDHNNTPEFERESNKH